MASRESVRGPTQRGIGWLGMSGGCISWSKLNYSAVLALCTPTFGNEPLNPEEERRDARSKLHFRGGNHASYAKHGPPSFARTRDPDHV